MGIERLVARLVGGDVIVSWNHDESGPPTQFNVERQVEGSGYSPLGSIPFVAGQTDYSITDAGAPAGSQYRVNAENSAGNSDWAESDVVVFVPNPPTNVVATGA